MTTQELIKQAEAILFYRDRLISGTKVVGDLLNDVCRVYNMVPDLLAALNKYREALEKIKSRCGTGFQAVPFDIEEICKKALGE